MNQSPGLNLLSSSPSSGTVDPVNSRRLSADVKELVASLSTDGRPKLPVRANTSQNSSENLLKFIQPTTQPVSKERAATLTDKEREKIVKTVEKEREKIEKEFGKIEKDREKKETEREKHLEKQIEKIEANRGKDEHAKDQKEREGKLLSERDMKDAFKGQRVRLHELFSQIEKEFELLWEENQDMRKKLEEIRQTYPAALSETVVKRVDSAGSIGAKIEKSRLNPLKKKDREPEWEKLTHFVGHRDGIWDVTTCKWEKHAFATASADRTARVWSSDTQSPVYIYTAHSGSVNSVRFHPTLRLACTGSGDNTCHVWKIPKSNEKEKSVKEEKSENPTNKPWTPLLEKQEKQTSAEKIQPANAELPPPPEEAPIHTSERSNFAVVTISKAVVELKHKGPVIAADWASGGERIISGSWDNTIKVWTLENNGRCLLELESGHDSLHYLTNITTHPVAPLALSSSSDGYFRIWDLRATQPLVSSVAAHSDIATSAVFSLGDENIIVSGSDDRNVKIWDKRNFKSPRNVIKCSSGINRIAVAASNSLLAIPLDDSRTKIAEPNGKVLARLLSKHHSHLIVTSAAWSNDESVIFTGGFDKAVIAWAKPKKKPTGNV